MLHLGVKIKIAVVPLHFRASELAFALDPLPKDELPPTSPLTEVCKTVMTEDPSGFQLLLMFLFLISSFFHMQYSLFQFFIRVCETVQNCHL